MFCRSHEDGGPARGRHLGRGPGDGSAHRCCQGRQQEAEEDTGAPLTTASTIFSLNKIVNLKN